MYPCEMPVLRTCKVVGVMIILYLKITNSKAVGIGGKQGEDERRRRHEEEYMERKIETCLIRHSFTHLSLFSMLKLDGALLWFYYQKAISIKKWIF